MRAIVDSDVLIDYLQGVEAAKVELSRYRRREISIISWMDVMIGVESPHDEKLCREFLGTFLVHPLTNEIATEAVAIRKAHRLRLPDAIVWATARTQDCLLVSRNKRDFPLGEPGVRNPYTL